MPEGFAFNWIVVLLVGGIGLAAIGMMFLTSFIMAPKRPSAIKDTPYECGIPPAPYNWSQIHIRYYVFALLFVLFDVEAVFLFPWATRLEAYGTFGLIEMAIFIFILLLGLLYAWRKGMLRWV